MVQYRYLICSIDPVTENVHVRRWETHLNPRQISVDHSEVKKIESKILQPISSQLTASKSNDSGIDTFGDVNGVETIDRGWLTTETLFVFKFINNPFFLEKKLKNRILYVKVRV